MERDLARDMSVDVAAGDGRHVDVVDDDDASSLLMLSSLEEEEDAIDEVLIFRNDRVLGWWEWGCAARRLDTVSNGGRRNMLCFGSA